jgi:hypothetical protein
MLYKPDEVDERSAVCAFSGSPHNLHTHIGNRLAANKTIRHKKRQRANHHSGKEPNPKAGSWQKSSRNQDPKSIDPW